MNFPLQFGIDSFGDIPVDSSGQPLTHAAAIRQVVAEAVTADRLGIDVIALGEHHRPDFAISSPETVLAGIATQTQNIKLASGVTVLSSDDPVRVFQRFATVDALSNGRAQVILGRGSFTESFPLFGYDLRDYDTLFEEKINLFAELLKEKPVSWQGTMRPNLTNADVFPKTESGNLETWVGVGGSPDSAIRTAHYGFPLMLAIIGGSPERFAPYVDLFHQALQQFGRPMQPVGLHSPGNIAETDQEAADSYFDSLKVHRDRVGKSRGWPEFTREQFESEIEFGSMYVGSPETVAQKIAKAMKVLNASRFDLVYGFGPMPVETRERTVELFGSQVVPRVKELLASESGADEDQAKDRSGDR